MNNKRRKFAFCFVIVVVFVAVVVAAVPYASINRNLYAYQSLS